MSPQCFRLILLRGSTPVQEYALKEGDNFTIGRAGFNNQISIEESTISRNHAQIAVHQGQLLLADKGSTNGTYINAQRIQEQKKIFLKELDNIRFGQDSAYLLKVETIIADKEENLTTSAPVLTQRTPVAGKKLIPHFSQRKWGYVDNTGKVSIDYQFEESGYFQAKKAKVKKQNKYGLIDESGNFIIPPKFDQILDLAECLIGVKVQQDYFRSPANLLPKEQSKHDFSKLFGRGLSAVWFAGKYGFLDPLGRTVLPVSYDYHIDFSKGLGQVSFLGNNALKDAGDSLVIPFRHFQHTLSFDYFIVETAGRWGVIDITGNVIVPFQYENIRFYSEGSFAVKKNQSWGFIDVNNREVVPFQFEDAKSFSCGLAAVKKSGWWGFVDIGGKPIVPFRYEDVSSYAAGFSKLWSVNAEGVLIMD